MQIEDFLSHSIEKTNLNNARKQSKAEAFVPVSPPAPTDKVTLSSAAKDMQQNGTDLKQAARFAQKNGAYGAAPQAEPENQAKLQFKNYMDKALNRGVAGGGKTLEEKIEEQTEKIKKLKVQLAEVMADTDLPENVKNYRMQSINSQIKAAEATLDQLGKELSHSDVTKSEQDEA